MKYSFKMLPTLPAELIEKVARVNSRVMVKDSNIAPCRHEQNGEEGVKEEVRVMGRLK